MTFVASGSPDEGAEDVVCAELIADLLQGAQVSADSVAAAVRRSRAAVRHLSADPADNDPPAGDLDCALSIDKFPFAMKAVRHDGRVIARPFVADSARKMQRARG